MIKNSKNIDYISYIKIIFGTLIVSPLLVAFFSYDYTLIKSIGITAILYLIILPLGIIMFNYLETGHIFKASKKNSNHYL